MQTFLGQCVASTSQDIHGERLTKQFLERFCEEVSGSKQPLHDQHDMSLPVIGYVDNFRVESDPKNEGEWLLIADIFINDNVPIGHYGGFSVGGGETISKPKAADVKMLIGYPYYNDIDLIKSLSADGRLEIGKWIRKGGSEFEWGTIFGSLLAIVVAPVWDDIYKRKIAPRIDEVLSAYMTKLHPRGIHAQVLQVLDDGGRLVQVLFIPSKGREAGCLNSLRVKQGLEVAVHFIRADQKSSCIGVSKIVLFFDDAVEAYRLHRVEYSDGGVEHHA